MRLKLKLIGGGVLGGNVLAAMLTLGTGGTAGADVVIPIPDVGAVAVVSTQVSSNRGECVIAQLNADPSGPLGACIVDETDPVPGGSAGLFAEVLDGGNPIVIPLS